MSERPFDQAQIWDDSALQAIWNASVHEYKRYHSIHARGEDVAEVLYRAAAAEAGENDVDFDIEAEADASHSAQQSDGEEDGEIAEEDEAMDENVPDKASGTRSKSEKKPSLTSARESAKMEPGQMNGMPSFPQAMISQSTHDEKLKNLMMSWYWAGYYTGLYEGQQQGRVDDATKGS